MQKDPESPLPWTLSEGAKDSLKEGMRKSSGTLRRAGITHIETSLPCKLERTEAFCDKKGAQSPKFQEQPFPVFSGMSLYLPSAP